MNEKVRCAWPYRALELPYHDEEWGTPSHDDRHLFEHLVLGGAQAGLSWSTILQRRTGYRRAFADFDAAKVARFTEKRVEKLMADPGIIRNRQKIISAIGNAKAVVKVREEFGSLDAYLWRFVDGEPIVNQRKDGEPALASSPVSDAMSKDLKARGFSFVGTTICYAVMQSIGMVNDHSVECFRYRELAGPFGAELRELHSQAEPGNETR